MEIELREELEGEGDRAWEGEAGRLLALGKTICLASFGEAGTDSDLVLSMTLSALLCPECLCDGSSSPLLLFNPRTLTIN